MSTRQQLERVYDEHVPALFAFLLVLTGNEDETREVLQELFVKLARKPELIPSAHNEKAFLIRLARNLAIDRLRRKNTHGNALKRLSECCPQLFVAPQNSDDHAISQALNDALMDLPSEQRTVAHLKLFQKLTFRSIAQTLGISQNTAASRYRYALDKIQEHLRPLYEEIK